MTPEKSPPSSEQIEQMFAAARDGSTEALGKLLEWCRSYLLGIANKEMDSALLPKAGPSDVVQDAFLEAQRIFGRFEGKSVDELLAWLRAILLNKLSEVSRSYRGTAKRSLFRETAMEQFGSKDGLAGFAQSASTPSGVVLRDEQSAVVAKAMATLPPDYRQVVQWRQWEDLSFEEIGRRLEKSPDAARMIWWRAIERLEKELLDLK